MVLKLHGSSLATCTRRVAVILHEKQVPYELIEVNWAVGEHKSAAWKQYQPFGQIPYLDDDGFILFESRAIAKYIATKYASSGTPLLPSKNDLQTLALIDQGASIENNNFNPSAEGLTWELMFKKLKGEETDPKAVENFENTLQAKMEGFEAVLSRQKYIGGNELTYVDFLFCPYGEAITALGYDYLTNETKYPHVAHWWKEISSRDSWQAVKDGAKGLPA
ncbi:Glutathione S-transferase PM239X14; AltName: Full=GST class-phi [Serendipita indica DSM 11827]|uniref:glutathione transferase n=1 Tax=Serendipita indica (strain DSM 11827) TaxID=1109443 RepID=G4TS95_SERID|nr:Glutathione S-transferase PM239X14; AltName: Full=GST class-phi [Serendipita indica DSM 11827]CCA74188.1 probable glutathione S-transferase [Serendipita indica DSM 11827]